MHAARGGLRRAVVGWTRYPLNFLKNFKTCHKPLKVEVRLEWPTEGRWLPGSIQEAIATQNPTWSQVLNLGLNDATAEVVQSCPFKLPLRFIVLGNAFHVQAHAGLITSWHDLEAVHWAGDAGLGAFSKRGLVSALRVPCST